MKNIFLLIVAIMLTGCALDPVQQQRDREEAQRRQAVWNSMTPSQRCMAEADEQESICSGLRCFGQGPNGNTCRMQCTQQKSMAYQLCTYKK